jgi:predicted aspartyl protease
MATETAKGIAATKTAAEVERSAKSAATRAARKAQIGPMSERQKFVITTARNAQRAAKIVISEVEKGNDVSQECVQACAALAGHVGSLLLG